ncbi:amino acid permease 2 [Mollisia scopiformis]|uniref:Amino acid permease 2 n=1 Tax=Mollisia scopiformis TaxID=149040 RepID=A0A194X6S6_MOLSC|nr:amino acid permease 2 [Mollisia scopiformis]KUJ15784.1 amino acid permease 2 [Mollisia scopiformis]
MSESAVSSKEKSYEDIAPVQVRDTEVGKMHDIVNSDDELLREIGYKQEFKREFTRLSTLSYAISIMGVLGSVPATYAVPLSAGGPATAVWTWFAGTFFSMSIALSIAELVSAYPTAGGMYFVTKYVVPERHVPLASWIVGWSNFLGQTAGVTSVGYSVGQMLLAACAMGSDYDETTGTFAYTPTAEHTVGVSVAILIIMGFICSFPTKWLHEFILWFAPVNVIASVAICIALLTLTPNLNPASEVFGTVTDGSNWNSKGFSFMIGFLSVAWTMTDYDATTHISEETKQAAIRGPVAITQAVIISGVVGWLLNVTFGFCAGDVTAILGSGLGNPVAQIFYNANGKKAALAMWFWAILIQFFTGCAAMLADTRMCYAFSRDHALPFSSTLKKMNPRTQTPLHSVWLVTLLCCLLCLIALGSVETINSIFGITAPALDCSYMAVVAMKLYYGKQLDIRKGPFTLGKWSRWVNYVALAWVSYVTVVLLFPTSRPVIAVNMNYAVVVGAAIAVFALVWWYAGARKVYVGPRVDHVEEEIK